MEAEKSEVDTDDAAECSGLNFPRPDFTEIVPDYSIDSPKPNDVALQKPTFKNILQAKKRLQAFSSKTNSLLMSPSNRKAKEDEKSDEGSPVPKKTKKTIYHDDRARAVIEEIEEIKRREGEQLENVKQKLEKRSEERFKRVDKRARNYRRRSSSPQSPIRATKSPKKVIKHYPRNWREFRDFECTFDINKEHNMGVAKGINDPLNQLKFQQPSLTITPYKFKLFKGGDKTVPFHFMRHTRAKPVVCYSVNDTVCKEHCVTRKEAINYMPREHLACFDKLHNESFKFKDEQLPKNQAWYPKTWRLIETDCKLLETSISLAFLQTYTADEEEPPAIADKSKKDKEATSEKKPKKAKKKKKSTDEMKLKKKKKKDKSKQRKHKESTKKKKNKKKKRHVDEKTKENEEEKREKHQSSRKRKRSESDLASKRMKIDKQTKKETDEPCDNSKHKKNSDKKQHRKLGEDKRKKDENAAETTEKTPDTDDYHSHWESDDDIAPPMARPSLKPNRSWESDEELFDRTCPPPTSSLTKVADLSFTSLEIPLNIQNFSRRLPKFDEELKQLAEERRKLEIEKEKLMKMKQEVKELKEEPKTPDKTDESAKVESVEIDTGKVGALEDEYEEFMKAVESETGVEIAEIKLEETAITATPSPKKKVVKSSSESSSSDSSDYSTSDDSSDENERSKKKKQQQRKKRKLKAKKRKIDGLLPGKDNNRFNEFDIPVPSDLPEMVQSVDEAAQVVVVAAVPPPLPPVAAPIVVQPLPVPPVPLPIPTMLPVSVPLTAAAVSSLNASLSTSPLSSANEDFGKQDEVNLITKPFVFSSLTLAKKKSVLEPTKVNLNDEDDEEEEKSKKKKAEEKPKEEEKKKAAPKEKEKVKPTRRSRSNERDSLKKRKKKSPSPAKRRYSSPPRRRSSPLSRRRSSPLPARRRSSPLGRRRRRSPSLSPIRSSRRKRSLSPPRRRNTASIASPLNSPLDGFKRSVADSTISDDMLPQPSGFNDSPSFHDFDRRKLRATSSSLSPANRSPKRISLDDRINQVLGLEKSAADAKMMNNEIYGGYPQHNYQIYEQQQHSYGQYGYGYKNDYGLQPNYSQSNYMAASTPHHQPSGSTTHPSVKHSQTKVVQVGNILQVVPNEELSHHHPHPHHPQPMPQSDTIETQQKIVQVGNMLQIVPAVMQQSTSKAIDSTPIVQQQIMPPVVSEQETAELMMKQRKAERKLEREKRRQERDRRRKDKEKKRKEREKRKQMKQKVKTENLIKRALQLETENDEDDEDEDDEEDEDDMPETKHVEAPISVIVSTPSQSTTSILLVGGSKTRKSVRFADGIRPGEGTSPSGGEELSSPPPQPPRALKEKKKLMKKKLKMQKEKRKKKKVKVVSRKKRGGDSLFDSLIDEHDDDEEYENLPPPSPPPGSPPPHIFPSRIKTHAINNVHQFNLLNSGNVVAAPGYPYRPLVMSGRNVQPPPPHGYLPGAYPTDLNSISHATSYQGVSSRH